MGRTRVSTAVERQTVDITVLVCTYNRCADLRELLASALAQETDGLFTYEILVVDNNSSDGTRQLVAEVSATGGRAVRYLFEGQQGKSFALNAGLRAARGQIYLVVDDDQILPPDYLRTVWQAFRAHPQVSVVSGKVLPLWSRPAPAWLTPKHWSALALADYGAEQFYADADKPICLLAGAFRLADVQAVGGYDPELGVWKRSGIGIEDAELLTRLYKAGRRGLYLPGLALHHKVEPQRLTKTYHRRWHVSHGQRYAAMRAPEMERARARLFDVPAHLYGQAATAAAAWLQCFVRGRWAEAFTHETRLCFCAGFFGARSRSFLSAGASGLAHELTSLVYALGHRLTRRAGRLR